MAVDGFDYAPETPDRKETGLQVARALGGAHLVGFDHAEATICVWYGSASFNVYDAETWEEVGHFTMSAGFSDKSPEELLDAAKVRMASEGFDWEDPAGGGR